MTLTLPAVLPGWFGDEAGAVGWWDGERWGEPAADRHLLAPADRSARLDAQVAAFERAGYRVERRDAAEAVLVRDSGESRRRLRRSARPGPDHRVTVSIDAAGAVRFA